VLRQSGDAGIVAGFPVLPERAVPPDVEAIDNQAEGRICSHPDGAGSPEAILQLDDAVSRGHDAFAWGDFSTPLLTAGAVLGDFVFDFAQAIPAAVVKSAFAPESLHPFSSLTPVIPKKIRGDRLAPVPVYT
jgi:hypothetical protein